MSDLTADTDAARLAWGGSPTKEEAPKEEGYHDSPEPSPVVTSPSTAVPPQPAASFPKAEAPLASPASALARAPSTEPPTPSRVGFIPLVSVVDFHHARGPEVAKWFGAAEGTDPAVDYDWGLLPFMALSDGAHA